MEKALKFWVVIRYSFLLNLFKLLIDSKKFLLIKLLVCIKNFLQFLLIGRPNCVNAYWADVDLSHAKTLNQQFVVHTFAVKMALFMALGAENETIC